VKPMTNIHAGLTPAQRLTECPVAEALPALNYRPQQLELTDMIPTVGFDITGSVKRTRGKPRLSRPPTKNSLSAREAEAARLSRPPPKNSLSAREAEVCKLLVEGLRLKEVAIRLNISMSTADHHARNSYQKLGIRSRATLVRHFGQPNAPAERDTMGFDLVNLHKGLN
jgi:DNA-binding CsgD family transcriptional regulator